MYVHQNLNTSKHPYYCCLLNYKIAVEEYLIKEGTFLHNYH